MSAALGVSKEHITKTPGVCGGRACIAGTRIRVMDLVGLSDGAGLSAENIVEYFTDITLADVHAALAYYYDHRDEIEADFEIHRQASEQGKKQSSKLKDAIARDPSVIERCRE